MSAVPLPQGIFRAPHAQIAHTLAQPPVRIKKGDKPIFVVCDAGMINTSDKIFPLEPETAEYKRLMALSVQTDRPIIFVAPPIEYQVVDHWKEERKRMPTAGTNKPELSKLRYWVRGAEGRGIVKEFEDMRSSPFATQYTIVAQSGLESIRVESCYEDLKPKGHRRNVNRCHPADRERNDVRIQSMEAVAQCLRSAYPGCEIHFYLRGGPIAARYHEHVQIARNMPGGNGKTSLEKLGVVTYGPRCANIYNDLDTHGNVGNIHTITQPTAYPSGLPSTKGWSRLVQLTPTTWSNDPTYIPRFPIPQSLRPLPKHVHCVVFDNDVSQGRTNELLQLVGLFDGNIQLVSLAEIYRESLGGDPTEAAVRIADMRRILGLKRSTIMTKSQLTPTSKPVVYKASSAPKTGRGHTGDLLIRVQLGLAISRLERQFSKSHVHVTFVTGDYGAGELARSVGTRSPTSSSSSTLKVLRVDANETGSAFVNLICDVIRNGCQ